MKYKIWIQKNNKIETIISDSDNLPENIIRKKQLFNKKKKIFFQKNDITGLVFEMKIMLEANLPFKQIVEILLHSHNTKQIEKILQMMIWSIENGKPLYKTLELYKKELGDIPILFFRFGEVNGDMKGAVSALYQLLIELDSIKEKLIGAMKYPLTLLFALLISLGVIFSYVIPKFEYLFSQFGTELPLSTQLLLAVDKLFLKNTLELGIFIFGFFFLLSYLYQNNRVFMGEILFHKIPYFSSMYQKIIIYKLFLSLYFICSTKSRFQNALENSLKISNNKYIEKQLKIILDDINSGKDISYAFEKSKLFDDSTLRLILSGEKSNSLEKVLQNIKQINKKRLDQSINNFTASLEPILIFILATVILWIVLAIMTPIWQLGNLMN